MTVWTALTLGLALAACGQDAAEPPSAGGGPMSMTLEVPRPPAEDEDVWAMVTTGDLPAGARVLVRMGNGELAGSIDQYGRQPGHEAGTDAIPLPPEAFVDGKVTLFFEVVERDAAAGRAPAEGEVKQVELILVPVTR